MTTHVYTFGKIRTEEIALREQAVTQPLLAFLAAAALLLLLLAMAMAMASSDEDTYSSEEHEASFASLEEESSSGSSSSSEYRSDELSDDDDEKENSNDDEDNLEGLIDPEADRYELKPARLNKLMVEAPPEEPSDASLESFGEGVDDTNDQLREDAVVVVDVEEVGDEEDEEIVVVEAEIVDDGDGEDCEEAGTAMQCSPVDNDDTMILSDESEPQENSVDPCGAGSTELDGPSIRLNDATILDQADSNLLRKSSQMNRGEEDERALDSPPFSFQEAGFELSTSPEECQRTDTLCSASDQISPHEETETLSSPPRDAHTEKLNSPTDKTQASILESPAPETEKKLLTPRPSETKRGNVKSPILRREDSVPFPTSELLHESMVIDGSQRSCQDQTCQNSAFLQSPTPKTEHGPGFYSSRNTDSSGDVKTPSVIEVAGRTPNPTVLYRDDQESMISAFASLRVEPNLGVTSPPLQSSEPIKSQPSDMSKPSCKVVSLSGRCLDESNAPDQNSQKAQSSKTLGCVGEVTSDVTTTSFSPTTQTFDTTENLPPHVAVVNGAKQRSSRIRREGSIKRGQWRLVKKIGSGSFGIVHMGINTHSGSMIAVKSVRMDAIAMKDSKREIQLLKALDHKNVVKYFGAEMNGQHLHIFQEWIPAGSIASLLAMVGPFPLGVLREYLLQVLEGLAYLHENNVVHRDIKGSNLLVTDKGVVKLADFGAGKQLCKLRMESLMAMTCRGSKFVKDLIDIVPFLTFCSTIFHGSGSI